MFDYTNSPARLLAVLAVLALVMAIVAPADTLVEFFGLLVTGPAAGAALTLAAYAWRDTIDQWGLLDRDPGVLLFVVVLAGFPLADAFTQGTVAYQAGAVVYGAVAGGLLTLSVLNDEDDENTDASSAPETAATH